jgi:NAD(P)-dependent dehydrogenase (short-subunit alcohol dehydrogenase family)
MQFNSFQLTDKTALITGGAGLLGVEHASALLESGARVVITDIDSVLLESVKNELSQIFDRSLIEIQVMDVTSEESIRSINNLYITRGIDISILVNNAAIDPKVDTHDSLIESSRLENQTLNDWNNQINVGLTGAFLCSKVFGSSMASKEGGIILNIASDLSIISPDQRLYRKSNTPEYLQPVKPISYSVVKSGLVGLTKYLSTYWVENGVRSNCLSPGGVRNNQPDDFITNLESRIPLGRMANKNEYRATVQYLCSDASLYMNGQNIIVDGGRSTW